MGIQNKTANNPKRLKTSTLLIIYLGVATLFLPAAAMAQSPSTENLEKPTAEPITKAIAEARSLAPKNLKKAIDRLEALEQKHSEHPELTEALANLYALKPGFEMQAALYFEQAFKLQSDRGDLLVMAAHSHAKAENPESAIKLYQIYLSRVPKDFVVWKALAKLQSRQGQKKAALESFGKMLECIPRALNIEEKIYLGRLHHINEHPDKARKLYTEALTQTQKPEHRKKLIYGLLNLALHRKDVQRSHELLVQIDKEFLGEFDQSPYAKFRKPLEQWSHQRHQKIMAQREVEKRKQSIQRKASEREARRQLDFNRAILASQKGNYALARNILQGYLVKEPANPELFYRLSKTYSAAQAYADAETLLIEAVRLGPQNSAYRIELLKVLEKTRSDKAYFAALSEAREYFPSEPEFVWMLAEACDRIAKDPKRAEFYRKLFIKLAPNDPRIGAPAKEPKSQTP